MVEKYKDLIREYQTLKDELLEYTEEYHDGMYYDLEGYKESLYSYDIYIDNLEAIVCEFKNLIDAYRKNNAFEIYEIGEYIEALYIFA